MKKLIIALAATFILPTLAQALTCTDSTGSEVNLQSDTVGSGTRINDIVYEIQSVQISPDGASELIEMGSQAHGAVNLEVTCSLSLAK